MKRRCVPLLLLALLLAPWAARGLTEEQVAFFQARTQEWEAVLGPHQLWDYRENAMYGAIYGRIAGDDMGADFPERGIPRFPPADVLPYDAAVATAKAALTSYDPLRITQDYLDGLEMASQYLDFWNDIRALHTITRTDHMQVWFISFFEQTENGLIIRCDAYVNAQNGQAVTIDIGLDMKHPMDGENHYTIDLLPQ